MERRWSSTPTPSQKVGVPQCLRLLNPRCLGFLGNPRVPGGVLEQDALNPYLLLNDTYLKCTVKIKIKSHRG